MSYKAKKISLDVSKKIKDSLYINKFANWVFSECKNESQLLNHQELNDYFTFIDGKVLETKKNLFVIKSILSVCKKQLALNSENEQQLTMVMLSFVEKVQKEQLTKISNPCDIAYKILIWSKGKPSVLNTILRALLHSETLIYSDYLKNLTLWVASKEQDLSLLLTDQTLQFALNKANGKLSAIEDSFLVRSLVFNLRVS